MAEPPVPVLMLYDPEEFWEQVRKTVREEIAAAQAQQNVVQSAMEKAGLPLKPAYTPAEIKTLFQLSDEIMEEWTSAGLLRLTPIGRQAFILYSDLLPIFQAT
jgi:hypothetical protein